MKKLLILALALTLAVDLMGAEARTTGTLEFRTGNFISYNDSSTGYHYLDFMTVPSPGDFWVYNSTSRGWAPSRSPTVNVKDYGAKGDGVTNDTNALIAAGAAALSRRIPLELPPGTYRYYGCWEIRTSLSGYGATIIQINNNPPNGNTDSTVLCTSISSGYFKGLAVDGAGHRPGVVFLACANVSCQDITSTNVAGMGIGLYNCDNVIIDSCRSSGIKYYTTPSTGQPADGYFIQGHNITVINSYATDFRRIGFTSDTSDPNYKSENIVFINDVAWYGHDCDDSTTEYNAGFWAENSNNVYLYGCSVYNISGTPGQTSGRIRGVVLSEVGSSKDSAHRMSGGVIDGGAGYIPIGLSIAGSARNHASLNEVSIRKASTGVYISGIGSAEIRDISLDHIDPATTGQGGILIYNPSKTREDIIISGVVAKNCSWGTGNGIIYISQGDNINLTVEDVAGGHPFLQNSPVSSLRVARCSFLAGSGTGSYLHIADATQFSQISDSEYQINFMTGIANTPKVMIQNTIFRSVAPSSVVIYEVGNMSVSTSTFERVRIIHDISGCTGTHLYSGCSFLTENSNGAIITDFSNPTNTKLMVCDSYFLMRNATDVPIQKWNYNPTKTIISDCATNANALYNLDGGVTAKDNSVTW